jgi:hypothetical protein
MTKTDSIWKHAQCPICHFSFDYTGEVKPQTCGKYACIHALATKRSYLRRPLPRSSENLPPICVCGGLMVATFTNADYRQWECPDCLRLLTISRKTGHYAWFILETDVDKFCHETHCHPVPNCYRMLRMDAIDDPGL